MKIEITVRMDISEKLACPHCQQPAKYGFPITGIYTPVCDECKRGYTAIVTDRRVAEELALKRYKESQ